SCAGTSSRSLSSEDEKCQGLQQPPRRPWHLRGSVPELDLLSERRVSEAPFQKFLAIITGSTSPGLPAISVSACNGRESPRARSPGRRGSTSTVSHIQARDLAPALRGP